MDEWVPKESLSEDADPAKMPEKGKLKHLSLID